MIDLVYLAHGRPEFTEHGMRALIDNTNWALVRRLIIYTDGDLLSPGCFATMAYSYIEKKTVLKFVERVVGGPVNVMRDYLSDAAAWWLWAKIDNDVIVPPGWLDRCLAVMESHSELDLLGIEPPLSRTRAPWSAKAPSVPEYDGPVGIHNLNGYVRCDAIGGIGLFRSRAWWGRSEMRPHSTYGGFTDWQLREKAVVKGWIVPPLDLFLLDRLTGEPWDSLNRRYLQEGLQRPWTKYESGAQKALAGWWLDTLQSSAK